MKFYDKPKKFEPGPKSVGFKHIYLSKLWYSQIMPPENLHLVKIKKAIGKYFYGLVTCIKSTEDSWL
jgi:hypothetical protein